MHRRMWLASAIVTPVLLNIEIDDKCYRIYPCRGEAETRDFIDDQSFYSSRPYVEGALCLLRDLRSVSEKLRLTVRRSHVARYSRIPRQAAHGVFVLPVKLDGKRLWWKVLVFSPV